MYPVDHELSNLPASASQVLGLQMYTTQLPVGLRA